MIGSVQPYRQVLAALAEAESGFALAVGMWLLPFVLDTGREQDEDEEDYH